MRQALNEKAASFEEKEMMGGLTFMVNGKMCVGIIKESMMARIGPDAYSEALKKKGCREMDFTKRPLKGFVYVDPEGYDMDEDLEYWISLALEYNPKAKSSKKKRTRK
ncbi:TfoX/Sxy family protein [Bacteroidota bacterium]